jgi:thiamine pyrophosphate-dependent acetolactate synthase large subunit-like protein
MADPALTWHRVLGPDELPEGRVKTVAAGPHSFALTHYDGQYAALSNRCPHQGGPLGAGTIEKGMLRCPWHGYDYCPLTGSSEFGDSVPTFPLEVRDDGIYVGIRHEGAAAFAASAFGKLTGRPAACLTIAGPGATNLLTGLWDANVDRAPVIAMTGQVDTQVLGPGATNLLTGLWDAKVDRAPVIALTGQVDTQVLGPGAFQEVDLGAAFGKVARWTQSVLQTSKHAELMALAYKHAILQQGPAHLIFPDEVQTQPSDAEPSGPAGRLTALDITPPADALARAGDLIATATRPVIIIGHGARFHRDEVIALAERIGAPVITTFKAKGQIPDDHPLACGVLGRSGTPVASWFMNEADLLVVLGASFSNHTGIYPGKPIVQVDVDPLQLGKFHPVEVPVWGEIGVTLGLLGERLREPPADRSDQRPEVADRWAIWRAEKASRAGDDRGAGVNSSAVFDALNCCVAEDAVIAVDVGNHAYSFGRYFECKAGQSVLMSGYLGSIGFGYPAAMGAWAAAPGRPVFAITGDGGFAQYMAEVTTAVKHGMNITHVLLNNGQLGKITKEQRAGDWDVWQTTLHNPDFSRYAELCGALGIRVTAADQLDDALAEQVISPLRVQATGNEIALQARPGGFGTPELPGGGWVGVSGMDVVRADGAQQAITSLRDAALFVGLENAAALGDEPLTIDADAAGVLAQAWADGTAALESLIADADPSEAASEIHLWPEHFDVAIELGDEAAGRRAAYGVSPGDELHAEPYAYVAPWVPPPPDPIWNSTAFTGAEGPPTEAPALWRACRAVLD